MKVGVISDIHANRVALEAVLEEMPDVETVVCAGDVVGYNPWPEACVETVRNREIPTVMGNHDRAVGNDTPYRFNSMAAAGVEYAREQLKEDAIEWLGGLPAERTVLEGRLKLVHGHPDDPDRYTSPELFTPDLLGEEDVLVMGHTHVQAYESYEEGIVLNPGSVGQPRDGDPRAAYSIVDLEASSVEQRRVAYDIETVIAAIETAGLPKEVGTRLKKGR